MSAFATPRTDANSLLAHEQLVQKAKGWRIDVYFVGDSITRRWGCTDPPYADFLAHWRVTFHGWNAANFGWGGDTTSNILWRLENGELPPYPPRVFVVLAGTNDVGNGATADQVAGGVRAIVDACLAHAPAATVLLCPILPRFDDPAFEGVIQKANVMIRSFADDRIRLVDITADLTESMTVDGLHLNLDGYRLWADALRPWLTALLGLRRDHDEAPPPTGLP